MSTRQYIGARYVPKFADPITWDNQRSFEALTIVEYLGASYTSKKPVPSGILPTNTEYWALTGNYNAQVEEYRQEVESVRANIFYASVLEYGADPTGSADSSTAVQNCINENNCVIFPVGTYKVTGVTIPSNRLIFFDGAEIVTSNVGFIGNNVNNITFTGFGTIRNNDGIRFARFYNAKNICSDANFHCYAYSSKPVYEFDNCEYVNVCNLKTDDSTLFLSVGSSYVKVHDLEASYVSDPRYCISVTRVGDTPYHDIEIYGCSIHGNSVLSVAAINVSIDIEGGGTLNPDSNDFLRNTNISIHDNVVQDCIGQCDGIDILYAGGATLSNNIIRNCLEGIAVLSQNTTITNCFVTGCRGVGIALGDPSIGSGGVHYTAIVISNSVIIGNGTGAGEQYHQPKANIGFIQHAGGFVSSVFISNVICSSAEYGIYANENVGGSNIVISSSFIYGTVANHSIADMSQFYFKGNATINRRGLVTPPAVSTTNVTNETGTDIDVHFINNSENTVTIFLNDVGIFGAKPHSVSTYRVYANSTTRVSDATDCNWTWQSV